MVEDVFVGVGSPNNKGHRRSRLGRLTSTTSRRSRPVTRDRMVVTTATLGLKWSRCLDPHLHPTLPAVMEYLQARLDSFAKSKRSKASSTRHTSSSSKWPHPSSFKATPDSLAEAGFYFDPDSDNPDNVTCFMCKKGVAGWEPEDDPFSIHYDKCAKTCAWAMVRCQRGVGGGRYASFRVYLDLQTT